MRIKACCYKAKPLCRTTIPVKLLLIILIQSYKTTIIIICNVRSYSYLFYQVSLSNLFRLHYFALCCCKLSLCLILSLSLSVSVCVFSFKTTYSHTGSRAAGCVSMLTGQLGSPSLRYYWLQQLFGWCV